MFQESGPSRPEEASQRSAAAGPDAGAGGGRNRHRRSRGAQKGQAAEAPRIERVERLDDGYSAPRPAAQPGARNNKRPKDRQGGNQQAGRAKHQGPGSQGRGPRPNQPGQGGGYNAFGSSGGKGQAHGNRNRRVRPPGRESVEIPHRPDRYDEERFERNSETWWADAWLHVLNRFGWKGRVASGRLYANDKRVLSFAVESGRIRAKVQGTRVDPYDVTIALKPLPDADWDLAVDMMSCQALFTAQLLAGDMPQDVEEVFDAARAPLFPRHKEDIQARCTCPDPANPCKHIAAVFYVMAEAFDKDPFMIFHLRGRSREALLAQLREKRAEEAQAMTMNVESLDAGSLEPLRFWQAGEELEAVTIAIAPATAGTSKRLGRPPFWRSPADPITQLGLVYDAIARRAREVALNESLAPAGVAGEG